MGAFIETLYGKTAAGAVKRSKAAVDFRNWRRSSRDPLRSLRRHPAMSEAADSSVEHAIPARERDLGDGFKVRRVLPSLPRRMVGPFIFFDQMGPITLPAGRGLDVRPHPHINLATVTYLFQGEILHRDSLGSEQLITPGAVNWMTAGRGIAHSERSPAAERKSGARVHGLQLWAALPTDREETPPAFDHYPAADIPSLAVGGAHLRVIAGSAFGVTSPVRLLSPLFYAEAALQRGATLELPTELGERAAYVVEGAITCDGLAHAAGNMVVFRDGVLGRVAASESARVMLLGGAPVGERHIWWNFVASSLERIEQAKRDWHERRFAAIPGDDEEFIPLPSFVS
jgi:hypothetical protein